jgi:dCTP deaminase
LRDGAVLEKGRVYVVPLLESIKLKSEVAAFANPKSSTGRLDILTRLIADEATHFDQVEDGYEGQLYIEIAPRSFSVVVRTGTRLNQLRFRRSVGVRSPIGSNCSTTASSSAPATMRSRHASASGPGFCRSQWT